MALTKIEVSSISNSAITTAKIADVNVTTAKIADDAVTLAKLAAGTDGELITWDASGNPAVVAVGTATHVLTSNGTGAAPTFQEAAGGNTELISHQTISNVATISFTGLDTHTDASMFEIDFIVHPATNNNYLDVIFGTGASPTYVTSGYAFKGGGQASAAGYTGIAATSRSSIGIGEIASTNWLGSDAGEGIQGRLWFIPQNGDNSYPRVWWTFCGLGADAYNIFQGSGAGTLLSATTITALQFGIADGSNLVSGFFSLRKYLNA